jgi:DNA-directed RNA polymerase subunit D
MADIETVDETEDVLKLKIEGINEAVANSLRRSMMVKVPTLSISELEVSRNESGLIDETLANRIGQVPFTIPENVDVEDEVHIALKQEGPGTVLAEDLKANNDEAEPVNPEAIIVELKEDQGLELEATAELGTGEEHAKHQGGTVGYEKIDETTYEFRIESTSGYSNEELFERAIESLRTELDQFEEAVAEL